MYRTLPMRTSNARGFTLVEVLIAFGVAAIFVLANLSYFSAKSSATALARTSAAGDRIVSSVRSFAGMPAALRNSMRAATGGVSINPQFYACTSGVPANGCANGGPELPLTLYTPLIALDPFGVPAGIQPISSPTGTTNPLRFDSFGSPCVDPGPTCAILVFTSFTAQCAAPPLPSPIPAVVTPALMVPSPTCTVAESVTVTYTIQLDPNLAASLPGLSLLVKPFVGSVVTSIALISGNTPQ